MRFPSTGDAESSVGATLSFRWFVPIFLLAVPLIFLSGDMTLEGYWLLGKYAIAASVIFLLGVKSLKGIWIVGGSLVGVISLGVLVGLTSSAEMGFIGVPFGYVFDVVIAAVGAIVDTTLRICRNKQALGT